MNNTINNTINNAKYVFDDFIQFFTKRDVINVAMATTIALYINNLTNDLIKTLINPIIKRIFIGKNSLRDEFIYTIFGIQFEIGKIIEIILQFMITMIIIYFMYKFLPSLLYLKNQ